MLKKLEKAIVNFLNNWAQDLRNFREPTVWVDIEYYPKVYQVSNKGEIKSLERIIDHPQSKTYTLKERILKPSTDNGFARVFLYHSPSLLPRERAYVHRIVAETFVPNPHNYRYVIHKDGNRLNNDSWNLEWKEKRNSPR